MVGLSSLAPSWELAALIYEAKQCQEYEGSMRGAVCLSQLTPAASQCAGELGTRVHPLWKGQLLVSALRACSRILLVLSVCDVKIYRKQFGCVYCSSKVALLIPGLQCGQDLPVLLPRELKKPSCICH